jgi:hypothetical protein
VCVDSMEDMINAGVSLANGHVFMLKLRFDPIQ